MHRRDVLCLRRGDLLELSKRLLSVATLLTGLRLDECARLLDFVRRLPSEYGEWRQHDGLCAGQL